MGRESDRRVPVEVQDVGTGAAVLPRRTAKWVPPRKGFVLVGPAAGLIGANAEGLRILAYPDDPADLDAVKASARNTLRGLLAAHRTDRSEDCAEISSGRRRYRCCLIPVRFFETGPDAERIAVLIERRAEGQLALERLSRQFRLTRRERECVQLVARGLSNKEIADRLGLSTNTVKALLRLVMTKLAAPSRAAVIARLFDLSQPPGFPILLG
jgi:DNA-binding CsgD family transcriptional regulator